MTARRISRLGVGDGAQAVSTLGLLSDEGAGGHLVTPPLVASASVVFAPTVYGPILAAQSSGQSRRRVRPRTFLLPPLVASRSLVFWPIAEQNPPRPVIERESDDAVALMF